MAGDLLVSVPSSILLSSKSAAASKILGPLLEGRDSKLQDTEVKGRDTAVHLSLRLHP